MASCKKHNHARHGNIPQISQLSRTILFHADDVTLHQLMERPSDGVLSDATVKVEQAAGQMCEMSEEFLARLDALRNAVDGSRQSLTEAAQTMYALRPQSEE